MQVSVSCEQKHEPRYTWRVGKEAPGRNFDTNAQSNQTSTPQVREERDNSSKLDGVAYNNKKKVQTRCSENRNTRN